MSPVDKIDAVLFSLKTETDKISFDLLLAKMKEKEVVSHQAALRTILDKIEFDRLAFKITDHIGSEYWLITHEGLMSQGYAYEGRLQEINFKISENNALTAKTYADRILWATWCAGLAAILLLLWQVFLYFYPVHANYPYWIWENVPKGGSKIR